MFNESVDFVSEPVEKNTKQSENASQQHHTVHARLRVRDDPDNSTLLIFRTYISTNLTSNSLL